MDLEDTKTIHFQVQSFQDADNQFLNVYSKILFQKRIKIIFVITER